MQLIKIFDRPCRKPQQKPVNISEKKTNFTRSSCEMSSLGHLRCAFFPCAALAHNTVDPVGH